jgi:hypothetical protein
VTGGSTLPPRCNTVLRRASRAHRRSFANSQSVYTAPRTRTGPRSSTRATRTGADALLFIYLSKVVLLACAAWYTAHADLHVLEGFIFVAADESWQMESHLQAVAQPWGHGPRRGMDVPLCARQCASDRRTLERRPDGQSRDASRFPQGDFGWMER